MFHKSLLKLEKVGVFYIYIKRLHIFFFFFLSLAQTFQEVRKSDNLVKQAIYFPFTAESEASRDSTNQM